MKTANTTRARTRLTEVMKDAQEEPIRIVSMRHDDVIMLSVNHYEELKRKSDENSSIQDASISFKN
jgi:PHD/YefM family antitoxin component YafN of YafNO toxin-antitoxin module